MENKQKPTIEEVLIKHLSCTCRDPQCALHYWGDIIKAFAQEWASIETEHLRQENKTLKEQQRTLHVEVNSDSLAAAHYEKEIEQLRQENIQLHDKLQEWISKDAFQFNELEQLRQRNSKPQTDGKS